MTVSINSVPPSKTNSKKQNVFTIGSTSNPSSQVIISDNVLSWQSATRVPKIADGDKKEIATAVKAIIDKQATIFQKDGKTLKYPVDNREGIINGVKDLTDCSAMSPNEFYTAKSVMQCLDPSGSYGVRPKEESAKSPTGDKPAADKPAKPAIHKALLHKPKPAAPKADKAADKAEKPATGTPAAKSDAKPADQKPAADASKPAEQKPAAGTSKPADAPKPASEASKPAASEVKSDAKSAETTKPASEAPKPATPAPVAQGGQIAPPPQPQQQQAPPQQQQQPPQQQVYDYNNYNYGNNFQDLLLSVQNDSYGSMMTAGYLPTGHSYGQPMMIGRPMYSSGITAGFSTPLANGGNFSLALDLGGVLSTLFGGGYGHYQHSYQPIGFFGAPSFHHGFFGHHDSFGPPAFHHGYYGHHYGHHGFFG